MALVADLWDGVYGVMSCICDITGKGLRADRDTQPFRFG
jgi:hypothetical protein